jgi:diaminopimelate epimerase
MISQWKCFSSTTNSLALGMKCEICKTFASLFGNNQSTMKEIPSIVFSRNDQSQPGSKHFHRTYMRTIGSRFLATPVKNDNDHESMKKGAKDHQNLLNSYNSDYVKKIQEKDLYVKLLERGYFFFFMFALLYLLKKEEPEAKKETQNSKYFIKVKNQVYINQQ